MHTVIVTDRRGETRPPRLRPAARPRPSVHAGRLLRSVFQHLHRLLAEAPAADFYRVPAVFLAHFLLDLEGPRPQWGCHTCSHSRGVHVGAFSFRLRAHAQQCVTYRDPVASAVRNRVFVFARCCDSIRSPAPLGEVGALWLLD